MAGLYGRCWLRALLAACLAALPGSTACPRPCACYGPAELHCTFRYFTAVPAPIPPDVERINLGYNSLLKLTQRDFAGLEKLELLLLHSNEINAIPDKVFADLRSLQVLKMSYNKVSVLQHDVFHGLKSLVRLHMDHNQIEFVNPNVFYGLTSLRLVHLEGNLLKQLHPDTFVTLRYLQVFKTSSIKHIYLSDNALASLPQEMFSYLAELESIYLHGNPWACDCRLRWLAERAEQRPDVIKCKKDRSSGAQQCPVCASPKNCKGKNLVSVPPASLSCSKPVIHHSLKAKNLTVPDDGDASPVSPKDFIAPIGSVVLNMTDQAGSRGHLVCNIQKPEEMAPVSFDKDGNNTILRTSFSAALVCDIAYEQIQQLWSILALYSSSPLKLARDALAAKTPSISYRYKQIYSEADEVFTSIEAELRADPSWLMQSTVALQLDRTATTLSTLHLRYRTDARILSPSAGQKDGRSSWALIPRDSTTRTEHTVLVGGTVELGCQAAGEPAPAVEWVLADGSRVRAPYVSEDGRIIVVETGTFTLRTADTFDSGLYHCIGTNYNDADILTFRITVLDPDVEHSSVNGAQLSTAVGRDLRLPCPSAAAPDAAVSWVLPQRLVLHHSARNKHIFDNGTLRIQGVTERDSGYFRCVAANQHGADLLIFHVLVRKDGTAPQQGHVAAGEWEESDGSGNAMLAPARRNKSPSASAAARAAPQEPAAPAGSRQGAQSARQRSGYGSTAARHQGGHVSRRLRGHRRHFGASARRADPQRWAALLEKAKRNSTSTEKHEAETKPPAQVRQVAQAAVDEEELSGDPLSPEQEFMMLVTERATVPSPRRAAGGVGAAGPRMPLSSSPTRASPSTAVPPPPAPSPPPHLNPTAASPTSGEGPGLGQTSAKDPTQPPVPGAAGGAAALRGAQLGAVPPAASGAWQPASPAATAHGAHSSTPPAPRNAAGQLPAATQLTGNAPTTAGGRTPTATAREPRPELGHVHPHSAQSPAAPQAALGSDTTAPQHAPIPRSATAQAPRRYGRRRKTSGRRKIIRPGRVPGRREHRQHPGKQGTARGSTATAPGVLPNSKHASDLPALHNASSSTDTASPEAPLPSPSTMDTAWEQPAPAPALTRTESKNPQGGEVGGEHLSGRATQWAVLQTELLPPTEAAALFPKSTAALSVSRTSLMHVPPTSAGSDHSTGPGSSGKPTHPGSIKPGEHPRAAGPSPPGPAAGTAGARDGASWRPTATPSTTDTQSTRSKALRVGRKRGQRRRRPPKTPPSQSSAAGPSPTAAAPVSTASPTATANPRLMAAPALLTAAPALLTAAPALVTAAPALLTAAPALVTAAPALVTAAPALVTAAPALVTAAPALVTAAPALLTAAPALLTAAPALLTAAPALLTAAPAGLTAVPAGPTPAAALCGSPRAGSVTGVPAGRAPTMLGRAQRMPTATQPAAAAPVTALSTHPVPLPPRSPRPQPPTTTTQTPPLPSEPPRATRAAAGAAPPAPAQHITATAAAGEQPHLAAEEEATRAGPAAPPVLRGSTEPSSSPGTAAPRAPRPAPVPAPALPVGAGGGSGGQQPPAGGAGSTAGANVPAAAPAVPPRGSARDSSTERQGQETTSGAPLSSLFSSRNHFAKPTIIGGKLAAYTVLADSDAFIPCAATGNPRPTVEWSRVPAGPGSPGAGSRRAVLPDGTLAIARAALQDGGQYRCTATNALGSAQLLATLAVVAYPPRIAGSTRLRTAHAGTAAAMGCPAEGRPPPSISWILANGTHVSSASQGNSKVLVQPDGTLVIREVTVYDRGLYTCTARNPAGSDRLTVRLQVVAAPPAILEEKREQITAMAGETLSLPCTAAGDPHPSVHWVLPDGTAVRPLQPTSPKAQLLPSGTLRLRGIAPSDSGTYECLATSSTGSERRVVSLAVRRGDTLPRIAAASQGLTQLSFGDKLLLNCTATGEPEPSIIWRLPSRAVVDQWHRMGSRIQVYPNGSLAIEAVTDKDAGDYLCVARNKIGDDLLLMKVSITMKPAKIDQKQHSKKLVPYGKDFRVDCKASGSPAPEISWSLPDGTVVNNAMLADDGGRRARRYVLFDNGTLYLNRAGAAEEGDYTCYAQNTLGRDEMKIHIMVVTAAPRIKHSYKTYVKVKAGETALLDCEAIGEPRPKIFWLLPSSEMLSSSTEQHLLHANGSLSVRRARLRDAGQYVCVARNAGGDDTKLYRLDVDAKPPTINGLYTNRTVIKVTAVRHSKKQIDCRADGTPPPQIMWIMPDNIFLTAPYYGSRIVVHKNGTLEIRNLRPSDTADFICVARNDWGESTLVVRLEVLEMLRRPMFKNPFNEKIIAKPGEATTLNCSVDGNPPPEVSWMLPNGTWFSRGIGTSQFLTGSNGTLTIRNPNRDKAGKYRCAAKNQVGYIEKLIILEVAQKPSILTHPRGTVRAASGEAVPLHCLSGGSPRPHTTWTLPGGRVLDRPQINGKHILLENGTLVIREATVHDRGRYVCKARNPAGEVSVTIPVAVAAYPPRITARPPRAVRTVPGAAVQLSCTALGIPKPEITWELPDRSVLSPGHQGRASGSRVLQPQGTLLIPRPRAADSGPYTCTARNHLGSDVTVTYLHVI